jgi:chromosome segregation ATPase
MSNEGTREDLLRAWEEATRAPDSQTALRAFSQLKDRLAKWQEELVRDAVAEGASWDDVGAATGTSRQAAWARFRKSVDEGGGTEAMHDQIDHLSRRVKAETKELQGRVKELADKWRDEQGALREQMRNLSHQIADDRKELREEIRARMTSLRDEIRDVTGARSA